MEQLIMYWKNDGLPVLFPEAPEGMRLVKITDIDDGIGKWLDIVQYGLSDGRQDEKFYYDVMVGHENYDAQYCYLLMDGEIPVATVAVVFYPEQKKGYVHMVACSENYRGRGIGTYLNDLTVYMMKSKECETAWLTTDDWRIPAIKSYLRAGFTPDLSTDDFKKRWDAIFDIINKK